MDFELIPYYLEKGKDHKYWFEEEPRKLKELLPEFFDLPIVKIFAITSMTTSIEANVQLAIKALLQWKKGINFRGFLPTQIKYLNLIKDGKNVPGRKIGNFIKALNGDSEAVVVDIWMCKAFNMLQNRKFKERDYYLAPNNKEYDKIEQFCKCVSKLMNLEPRQFQSMLWAGTKKEHSKLSKNVTWSDILYRKRGMFLYCEE